MPMPVLLIASDKAMGDALEVQVKLVSDNVTPSNSPTPDTG